MSSIVVTPEPRIALYDEEGAQKMVGQCLESGKDPGFWASVAQMTAERQQRFDNPPASLSGAFTQLAYRSATPAQQIVVPALAPKRDIGMKH